MQRLNVRESPRVVAATGAGNQPRLHLVKVCAGVRSVEDLEARIAAIAANAQTQGSDPSLVHTTRNMPKRADELVAGGSIYWIMASEILCRQKIRGVGQAPDDEGRSRCALVLDPVVVRTVPQPRRGFQGWRYAEPGSVPDDLGASPADAAGDALPPELAAELARIGVL